jgi:hypothetical protein
LLKLLQQQKHEHKRIAKDPIFKEYHAEVKRKEIKLRGKGWKEAPRPQIDEDLEAEALQRMVMLVATAADDNSKSLTGVWARFGKPYQPLGRFEEV